MVFQGAFGPIPTAAINLYYYAVFAAGVVLAWRFHSSRILFALLTLVLAHRALEFFSSGRIASGGPGGIALSHCFSRALEFRYLLYLTGTRPDSC